MEVFNGNEAYIKRALLVVKNPMENYLFLVQAIIVKIQIRYFFTRHIEVIVLLEIFFTTGNFTLNHTINSNNLIVTVRPILSVVFCFLCILFPLQYIITCLRQLFSIFGV